MTRTIPSLTIPSLTYRNIQRKWVERTLYNIYNLVDPWFSTPDGAVADQLEYEFLDNYSDNVVAIFNTEKFDDKQDFKVNFWDANKALDNTQFANYQQRTYVNNVVVSTTEESIVATFRLLRYSTDQKSVKQQDLDATFVWAYESDGWKIVFATVQDVLISFSPLTAPS